MDGRGAASLLAFKTVYGALQISLPIDQWRLEVGNWFSISLAKLQQALVDYAVGLSSTALIAYIAPPQSTKLGAQCKHQRFRHSASNQTFNIEANLYHSRSWIHHDHP